MTDHVRSREPFPERSNCMKLCYCNRYDHLAQFHKVAFLLNDLMELGPCWNLVSVVLKPNDLDFYAGLPRISMKNSQPRETAGSGILSDRRILASGNCSYHIIIHHS